MTAFETSLGPSGWRPGARVWWVLEGELSEVLVSDTSIQGVAVWFWCCVHGGASGGELYITLKRFLLGCRRRGAAGRPRRRFGAATAP